MVVPDERTVVVTTEPVGRKVVVEVGSAEMTVVSERISRLFSSWPPSTGERANEEEDDEDFMVSFLLMFLRKERKEPFNWSCFLSIFERGLVCCFVCWLLSTCVFSCERSEEDAQWCVFYDLSVCFGCLSGRCGRGNGQSSRGPDGAASKQKRSIGLLLIRLGRARHDKEHKTWSMTEGRGRRLRSCFCLVFVDVVAGA